MNCEHCGSELAAGAHFCQVCGAPVGGDTSIAKHSSAFQDLPDEAELRPLGHPGQPFPLSDSQRLYYWTNLVLNPLLLLLLFAPEARDTVACVTAIWAMLSGLINPRIRGYMATILATGLKSLIATIAASCYVVLFGGIIAILLLSAAIVFAGAIYVLLLFATLVYLWVDALRAIRREKTLLLGL